MKKIFTSFVIIIMFLGNFNLFVYASNDIDVVSGAAPSVESDSTSIMSEDFTENFDPNGEQSATVNAITEPITDTIITVVNALLGVVQIIGGIIAVVSIAMFGLSLILKSNMPLAHDLGLEKMMFRPGGDGPEARRDILDYGRVLLIGSVLLFTSSTIVRFVINTLFF